MKLNISLIDCRYLAVLPGNPRIYEIYCWNRTAGSKPSIDSPVDRVDGSRVRFDDIVQEDQTQPKAGKGLYMIMSDNENYNTLSRLKFVVSDIFGLNPTFL